MHTIEVVRVTVLNCHPERSEGSSYYGQDSSRSLRMTIIGLNGQILSASVVENPGFARIFYRQLTTDNRLATSIPTSQGIVVIQLVAIVRHYALHLLVEEAIAGDVPQEEYRRVIAEYLLGFIVDCFALSSV